jgi:hypothetical protein
MTNWKNVVLKPETAARYDSVWQGLDIKTEDGRRYDANELSILTRQAEFIRSKTFEVEYAALKALQFIPLATDIPSWASHAIKIVFDSAGQARITGGSSDDAPRVDMVASEQSQKILSLEAAYGWSLMELRAALGAGLPLNSKKAEIALRVINTALDEILATGKLTSAGQTNTGLTGFINSSAVTVMTATAGSWAAATADAIIAEISAMIATPAQTTKDIYNVNTVLMAPAKLDFIAQKPRSSTSDTTVLEFLKRTNPGVSFEKWHRLTGAGGSGKDRFVAYEKSPAVVEGILPQQFETLPPQQKGFDSVVLCHARCGGVDIHQPKAMLYLDPTN